MENDPNNQPNKKDLQTEIEILQTRLTELIGQRRERYNPGPTADVLIEYAMFPIVIVNRSNGSVLYINKFASNYFSISVDQAKNRKASEFWHSLNQLKNFLQMLEDDDCVFEFEAELITATSSRKYALLSARNISYHGLRAVYTVFTDITDRVRAQRALQESEARYQEMYHMMKLMANTVPDMIWAKDLDDRYIFANTAICEKLLKCKKGEKPIGKKDLFFASRERSDGYRHTFGEICVDSDEVVKQSRLPHRFLEDGLVRGRYLALDVRKAPLLSENGRLIGTVGTGRDVTRDIAIQQALEQSDKRFRLLVDNVRDVLWVSDTEFTPTYVTPSIFALSGYTEEEFLSMPISVHMTPKYKKKFNGLRRMMASMIRNKDDIPARFFAFECRKKDGSIVWVEIITTAMSDSEGTLKGFTGVIRDSTKRVQEQKELELAKEVALAASQTKSEFLANMSHENRTPMNGVLGILQLLRDTRLSKEQKKYVETALTSGTSLLNLISDILDFSKIEAGKIELIPSPLVLEPLLQSVVDSFESLTQEESVSIDYYIDKNVPPAVVVDGTRLKQILFNLLGNAVKFTKAGKISVVLTAEYISTENEFILKCKISDTGRGISEKVISRLFEPFVQEDGSFQRKYGGTGLGLSIVKKLVEMMDGKVCLESAVGKGTVVRFSVKAAIAEKPDSSCKESTCNQSFDVSPKRVLVVEDEKINAMVISAMLSKIGHKVHVASNGLVALKKVDESDFDCIFMDIQMPEMDGVETTRAIRSTVMNNNRRVPIIALTAHAMKGDRERFIAAGMDDYLAKPVEMDSLIEVLSRLKSKGLLS
ncbi:MAG: PAS domain S-box protein [Desulforhopalus sp.]